MLLLLIALASVAVSPSAGVLAVNIDGTVPVPPTRLMVEYLLSPTPEDIHEGIADVVVIGTAYPRFSFIPGSNELPSKGVTVTAYQVVVFQEQLPLWDSGVRQSNTTYNIRCGEALGGDGTYTWTAQYWDSEGHASPLAHGHFDVGPVTSRDWEGSHWYGYGQMPSVAMILTM